MLEIHKVLCPVDFTELGRRELAIATEICRAFGAQLVLHHNLPASEPGFSKGWEWQGTHRQARGSMSEAEAKLLELVKTVDRSIPTQARISSGPLVHALSSSAEELPADLIVLGSHGRDTADHASLCDRLMDMCDCPMLCFEEHAETIPGLGLQPEPRGAVTKVLVPTDLSADAAAALEYAFALATRFPLYLHLLTITRGGQANADHACERLNERAPADLRQRLECHARSGRPIDEIADCANNLNPAFLVMGEHARGLVRAWLTRHTGRGVLHRIDAPIWFVPPKFEWRTG